MPQPITVRTKKYGQTEELDERVLQALDEGRRVTYFCLDKQAAGASLARLTMKLRPLSPSLGLLTVSWPGKDVNGEQG